MAVRILLDTNQRAFLGHAISVRLYMLIFRVFRHNKIEECAFRDEKRGLRHMRSKFSKSV